MEARTIIRTDPRISVNKLAEYVSATGPLRRQRIIKDQISPPAYQTARYEDARRAMARFLTDPSRTVLHLLASASDLRDKAATFPIDNDQRKWAIESARAVEAFAHIAEKVRRKNLLAVRGRQNESMMLAGVRVSISPDVCFIERGTERRVGALKFHCSITRHLDVEGLRLVAALLYAYLEAQEEHPPTKPACIAVDVMTPVYETAPRGMKMRLRNVEAACKEIATSWPILRAEIEEAKFGASFK